MATAINSSSESGLDVWKVRFTRSRKKPWLQVIVDMFLVVHLSADDYLTQVTVVKRVIDFGHLHEISTVFVVFLKCVALRKFTLSVQFSSLRL